MLVNLTNDMKHVFGLEKGYISVAEGQRCTQQYAPKKVLTECKEKDKESLTKDIKQLHKGKYFQPTHAKDLSTAMSRLGGCYETCPGDHFS